MSDGQLAQPVGADDHVSGPPEAPLTLVEYGDFECPWCGKAHPIVQSLQRALGPQLRLVFRNFLLSELHPHAERAAETAEAAAAQGKYWEMHDTLFEHQDALDVRDLIGYAGDLNLDAARVQRELETGAYAERVRRDFRSGVRSGVNGTPTFFINGERYDGNWTDETQFLEALQSSAMP
ncbi:MAG: DsbA family protein [Gemmatimonadaceae bacterium]